MRRQSLTAKRIFLNGRPATVLFRTLFSLSLVLAFTIVDVAQGTSDTETERRRAFDLLQGGKFIEAQAKFEKLVTANPSDREALMGLGLSMLATSKNIKDDEARRQARLQARSALVRAKDLGNKDDLLELALASIAPDGGEIVTFSNKPEVDKAMREGEAAFARGDADKAIASYQKALQLDPKHYLAAVFIGDMYFMKKQIDKAGEAYARAIAIDPDRETAYRYWSDVLLKSNRMQEARDKAVEAIVAEPYNRMAYNGLIQWAQQNNASLRHPEIAPPQSSADQQKSTSPDSTAQYWLLYDQTRATFRDVNFAQEFPDEKEYRHSLKEEAMALRVVAEAVAKGLKEGKLKSLDAGLTGLVKLNDTGLLEAYILFVRPDRGIAGDYAGYRKTNREKLKRYWLDVVIQ